MAQFDIAEQVTDLQLSRYARLVYELTGICISPQKKTLLSNRLRRRLRETGIDGYEAYYNHLRKLPSNDPEWDAFLQEITTHETYLFRDEMHWQWFQNKFLPEIVSQSRSGKRPRSLRIWSSACSTGDEVYTIACCLAQSLPSFSQWNIEIIGTDIGVGAIENAKSAEFGERAMRLVPERLKKRCFTRAEGTRLFKAKQVLSDMVSFRQHNLMDPFRVKPFDMILVKNVLIYFDKTSKATVLNHVQNQLLPGGLLICGAAEGASDLLGSLERLEPWLYRKP